MRTSCCGSLYGKGRNNAAFTTLKMAVVTPIPSPSVNTTIAAKPGFRANCRNANRMSFMAFILMMQGPCHRIFVAEIADFRRQRYDFGKRHFGIGIHLGFSAWDCLRSASDCLRSLFTVVITASQTARLICGSLATLSALI